jgi:hypothetical protein
MVDKPVFVVPWIYDLHLPEEDGVGIETRRLSGGYQMLELTYNTRTESRECPEPVKGSVSCPSIPQFVPLMKK